MSVYRQGAGAGLVRRLGRFTSSTFNPLSLDGCCAWFRSDLGVTTDTGGVSAWANQAPLTGAANDLLQSSSSNRPSLEVAGTDIPASPSIRFTAANLDILKAALNTFQTGTGGDITAWTAAVVFSFNASSTTGVVLEWRANSIPASSGFVIYQDGTNKRFLAQAAAAGSTAAGPTSTLNDGDDVRLIAVQSGTTTTLYQAGVQAGSTGTAALPLVLNNQEFNLGARDNGGSTTLAHSISIAEVVLYNRALTGPQIAQLDAYLARHGA